MKKLTNKFIYRMTFIIATSIFFSSCYKYAKDTTYASIEGSFIDAFTNKKMDFGNITLKPVYVTNGAMQLDTAGNFKNTRMVLGSYKIYGSIPNGCAFSSDSATITLPVGTVTTANLKVEPWISVQNSITAVTSTSVTVSYTIQGNKGLLPARHAIFYSTTSGITSTSYQQRPLFVTPDAGKENGTFSYTITGLTPNTTYYIIAGARIATDPMNPNNNYNQGRSMIVTTKSN